MPVAPSAVNWACPDDGSPLSPGDGGAALVCTRCSCEYPRIDGVPVLVAGEDEREATLRASAFVEELWRAVRGGPVDDALPAFCRAHDCRRLPYAADVKYLYPSSPGGSTLVLGAGLGDECLATGAISMTWPENSRSG